MPLTVQAGFDLSDGSYRLDVVETGGNTFAVTLTTGRHFLSLTGAGSTGDYAALATPYTSLCAAVQAALTAGTGGGAYTVTWSASTGLVTIAHNGAGGVSAVSLTPTTRGYYLGHTAAKSGALSYELDVTPYYVIRGACGFWSQLSEREDPEGVASDVIAHSGRPHGIARSVVPVLIDLTVPLETRAAVYSAHATTAAPWTWQDLYRHSRNTLPLALDDGELVRFVRLTERGAVFAPRSISADYVGHYDIPLRMRLLSRSASA